MTSEKYQLMESYEWCANLTRERARNFYYAIRLLPQKRREAMYAVYAFFRVCDDISDSETIVNRREKLEEWRSILDGDEPSVYNPGLLAFRDATRRFGIPAKYYHDLLDGIIMDLEGKEYKTFDDLYRYCYCVASTVGLVCIHIFGFDQSPEAIKMAEYRGIAFQLTNILRDIAEDADMGRVYIPSEILNEFSLTKEDLLSKKNSPNFEAMLKHMIERAENYYELSEPLTAKIQPVSRPSLRAMTFIYHGILEKIKLLGGNTLKQRARLSLPEKIIKVFQAYVVSYVELFKKLFGLE